MKVYVGSKTYNFQGRLKVEKLLHKLNLHPQSNIVIRNGEIVTEDEYLEPEDEVEIIHAISGG